MIMTLINLIFLCYARHLKIRFCHVTMKLANNSNEQKLAEHTITVFKWNNISENSCTNRNKRF